MDKGEPEIMFGMDGIKVNKIFDQLFGDFRGFIWSVETQHCISLLACGSSSGDEDAG